MRQRCTLWRNGFPEDGQEDEGSSGPAASVSGNLVVRRSGHLLRRATGRLVAGHVARTGGASVPGTVPVRLLEAAILFPFGKRLRRRGRRLPSSSPSMHDRARAMLGPRPAGLYRGDPS